MGEMKGHVIPLKIDGTVTVEGFLVGPMRAGIPALMAAYGKEPDTGESVYVVAYEWPSAYRSQGGSAIQRKQATEQRHIDRFGADYFNGTGDARYQNAVPGGDPPDFVVDADGTERGVEVTQLMIESRRSSASMFRSVRRAIIRAYPRDFDHLRGSVIYVMFDSKRPPVNEDKLEKVVAALKDFSPKALTGVDENLEPGFDLEFDGGRMSGSPAAELPQSGFTDIYGFEVALAYTTTISVSDAGAQLEAVIGRKDRAGNDEVLIAVGAPAQDGLAYPSDTVLAQAALQYAEVTPMRAQLVSSVYLHIWDQRAIYRLTPGKAGYETVCGEPLAMTPT